MRLCLVSQLLVLISVLALTRAQAAATTTTTTTTLRTTLFPTTAAWTAPDIFYPFGSAAGDTGQLENDFESYRDVAFSTPFMFFGRMYSSIYVNNNGLLTFNQPLPEAHPYPFPTYGAEDFIAPLWTELDDFGLGTYWFQEYTSGSVLTRATRDIKQYFPHKGFSAFWVFVATWDYVKTSDMDEFNNHAGPAITFQVVLISGGGFSFILMNYGDCAVISLPVEAGFDTVNSTDYHVIYYGDGIYIPNLKSMSNINVPGRWAFLVNNGTEIFYPFGSAAGDTEILEVAGDTYREVAFSTPFTFFGRMYNKTYVNNNGLLTFSQPLPESLPYYIPKYATEDFIAPLWTELDDYGIGKYSYQEYTSGSVLTRATQDINQYLPHIDFSASWVFVATWDYVQTFDMNVFELRSAPAITFQVVLISGGGFSFILMNYGDCSGISSPVQAGFDTIHSTDYYVIHYGYDGSYTLNLKSTSNVNFPGRWAFLVNNGTENVLGLQMKLSSFLDLTQTGNIEDVLQQIKQELVNHGVPNLFEIKLRKVKKIEP